MGARIEWPLAASLMSSRTAWPCPSALLQTCVLAGGDDYELVFTAPASRREQVTAAAAQTRTPVTRIGSLMAGSGIEVLDEWGQLLSGPFASFDHFAAS